jgi:hypothetical protein
MASTTFIDNQTTIFASWLNDVNTAVYTGVFPNGSLQLTTLDVSGSVSGAGFTTLVNNILSAPGSIGSATPNTGVFTTLSASSITSLTTPLGRAQGGTGLSAAGANGNVLTSDGTNWASSASQSIGLQQTWQDVLASRAIGTTYTNTTGRPIFVIICASASSLNGTFGITINGTLVYAGNSAPNSGIVTVSALIPPSATYLVTVTGGSMLAPGNWNELR